MRVAGLHHRCRVVFGWHSATRRVLWFSRWLTSAQRWTTGWAPGRCPCTTRRWGVPCARSTRVSLEATCLCHVVCIPSAWPGGISALHCLCAPPAARSPGNSVVFRARLSKRSVVFHNSHALSLRESGLPLPFAPCARSLRTIHWELRFSRFVCMPTAPGRCTFHVLRAFPNAWLAGAAFFLPARDPLGVWRVRCACAFPTRIMGSVVALLFPDA